MNINGKKLFYHCLIIILLTDILLGCSELSDNNHYERTAPLMFHVDEVGHGQYMTEDVKTLKNELNENMDWTAPHYFWNQLEPTNDIYNWDELDTFIITSQNKYRVLFVGPGFVQTGDDDFYMTGEIPLWLTNRYSNPQLKEEYGELLQEIVSRYKDDIYMWWIGGEVNLGGNEQAFSWTMWKDWLKWQINLMRAVDPDAKIAISFGSWTDYHEQMPFNAIYEIDGANELINEGINFDVIAIEYHYGSRQNGDLNNFKQALADLKTVGKKFFIWEVYYPGGTDSNYQSDWGWAYPPLEGYTEEWQANQLYETLKIAYEDNQIIGINMFHLLEVTYNEYDPSDSEAGWRCFAGLIKSDGTPKQAYYRVRDYWNEILSKIN